MSREYALSMDIFQAVYAAGTFRNEAIDLYRRAEDLEDRRFPEEALALRNRASLYDGMAEELEDQYKPDLAKGMDDALRKAGL